MFTYTSHKLFFITSIVYWSLVNTSAINIPRPVCLGVCTNASLHCEEATLIEVPDCSQNLTITSAGRLCCFHVLLTLTGGRVHKYPLFPNGSIQLPCSDFELPCTAPQDSKSIALLPSITPSLLLSLNASIFDCISTNVLVPANSGCL